MMQILKALQERHIYNVVHPRWATPTQKLPVLYYYTIQENEGIQPTTTLFHFLSHSHGLPHTITDIVYIATIPYIAVLQCFPFIGELPWENTMGHPIPWVHNTLANKHPKFSFGGFTPEPPNRARWASSHLPVGMSVY